MRRRVLKIALALAVFLLFLAGLRQLKIAREGARSTRREDESLRMREVREWERRAWNERERLARLKCVPPVETNPPVSGMERTPLPAPGPDESSSGMGTESGKRASRSADLGEELSEFTEEGTRRVETGLVRWKPGDTWKVESWHLRMQSGDGARWSEQPILWKYTVQGTEIVEGVEAHVVEVEPVDTSEMPFNPGGTFFLSKEDHTVLAVRDRCLERGTVRERFVRFDDAGNGAASVLFPLELPPPGTLGRERASGLGRAPVNPFLPDPKAEPPQTSGRVIDVEFESNGSTVTQRWDAAYGRWPLYSRTPFRVSYLRNQP